MSLLVLRESTETDYYSKFLSSPPFHDAVVPSLEDVPSSLPLDLLTPLEAFLFLSGGVSLMVLSPSSSIGSSALMGRS